MKKIIPILAFSVILFTSVLALGQSAAQHSSIIERVDHFIADLPDEFNGTILLAIGDTILMNKGYGWANRSLGIPNTTETKYELASVTKDFTTILAFKLIEMGLIDLDATIDTYLPDYPKDKASKITIRQLLLHRSGIRHHFQAIPDFIGLHDRFYHTPRELLELFWDEDLAHEPGEGTTYSSPGYWLLAIIMETVSGKSFAEMLDEHICRPLGMKDTHVDNNLTVRKNCAVGYKKGLNGYVADLKEVNANNLGAGDMISTTRDLYLFQRLLNPDNELVLSRKTKQLLFEEQYRINNYFVRTMVATLAQTPYNDGRDTLRVYGIGTGGNYGFQARLTRLVDHDATYIVLSNIHNDRTLNEQTYNFLQDILCEKLGIPLKAYRVLGPYPHSETPAEVPEERLRMYEGYYKASEDDIIHFFVENGRLSFRGYEKSFWNRIEVRGGELIPLGGCAFFDRNGFGPRYFMFVIPSELTAESPYAPLKSFFADTPDSNRYQLVRMGLRGTDTALWWSAEDTPDIDLTPYEGVYYSVELQKTFRFNVVEDHLIALDFLEGNNVSLLPVGADLFSCDKGFLVFHRYEDRTIRDFWLMSEKVDHVYGALFIRK